MRLTLLALTVSAVTLVLACSYAKGPPVVLEGRVFASERVASIVRGMDQDQVMATLGPPVEVSNKGDLELWRYYVWQRQEETVRFLGLFPRREVLYSGSKEVEVAFVAGQVEYVRSDHRQRP